MENKRNTIHKILEEEKVTNNNTSYHLYCMNCMTSKENEGICQVCGFRESMYQPSLHHLPLRTVLNGKYLIGRVLGEGGFGITYLGWDINLELKIAIKEYYPLGFVTRENTVTNLVTSLTGDKGDFFQDGREKFVEEARRLAKFSSLSSIVSIKDFFYENNTAYIVMEYVKGETLKQYLSKLGGKISADIMLELARPLIASLCEIHRAGIIHRDISPDNIMLTSEGKIKLIDFGAARDFSNSGNKSLSVMLKLGYAPEEQYRSRGIQGPWTDIYALCATIYKAITGITPDESCERLRQDRLMKPTELGEDILLEQEAIIMKGLAVLQEDRFQNMNELLSALDELQNIAFVDSRISFEKEKQPYEAIKQYSNQDIENEQRLIIKPVKKARYKPVFFMFIIIVILIIAYGLNKDERSKQTVASITPTIMPTQALAEVSINDLKEDEDPEIIQLFSDYYNAKLNADTESLSQLLSDPTKVQSKTELQNSTAYISAYKNIKTYVKNGLQDGTYIVYVYHEMKFDRIETPAPGLSKFYLVTGDDEKIKIFSGEMDEATLEYYSARDKDKDVIELINMANENAEKAIENDDDLKAFHEAIGNLERKK